MDLQQRILKESQHKFNEIREEILHYQFNFCETFQKWEEFSKFHKQQQLQFLPISFFKTHKIISQQYLTEELVFYSSGTSGSQVSKHYIAKEELYKKTLQLGFEAQFSKYKNASVLALLPSYQSNPNSSLIYMVDFLQNQTQQITGYFQQDFFGLQQAIEKNNKHGVETILFGVSYALIDFLEYCGVQNWPLLNVIETGGMKGKRAEWTKEELHQFIRNFLPQSNLYSEYGMTELLSQAYAKNSTHFFAPPWMKVDIIDINDPCKRMPLGKTGRICITDLANLYSCSFIATEDLGRQHSDGSFEVLGRIDFSDQRGCNLLYNG